MSYSLADLCNNIGLTGTNRNLRYIYHGVSLNMWAKVRPGKTTVNPYRFKGITPYPISNFSTDIFHLWSCDFSEDSEHLHHFYNDVTHTAYNHSEYPSVTAFTTYASANGAPIVPETHTVYNDTEDAGGATYNHEITCEINYTRGTDHGIGIEDVIGNGGKISAYVHPISGASHDYFIPNPVALENTGGDKFVIDVATYHWDAGTYRIYPYFQNAGGSPFSFPVTPQSGTYGEFNIVDVASIPYIPMTGVHWEYDWIDLAYISGSPQQGTIHAYMEAAPPNVPTHGLIGFTPLDSSVVDVVNPTGEVETVDTIVTLQSNSAGVAYVRATGHDKKAGSPTFQDLLKVYTGGRGLVLSPTSMDLRISATGNETTSDVVAKAAPDSSINTYTWTAADSTVLTIISTQAFQDPNDSNWHKSRCTIKGIKPNVPGSPTNLNCAAVEMNRNCAVSVYNPAVGITITQHGTQENPIQLEEGDTLQLNANLQGLNSNYSVSDSTLAWWSPATSVATVSANGLVTGVAANNSPVDITATTNNSKWNDWTTYTAHCYIKVVTPTPPYIPVTGIAFAYDYLDWGSAADTLSVTVSPNNATNKAITWYNNNSSALSLSNTSTTDPSVTVTPVAGAHQLATITATSQDNAQATDSIRIYVGGRSLNIVETSITLYIQDTAIGNTDYYYDLTVAMTPAGCTLTGSSSAPGVATINASNYRVTAVGVGSATVSLSGLEDKSDSCAVTVMRHIRTVSLSPSNISSLETGSGAARQSITVGFDPTSSIESRVKWSVSSGVEIYTTQSGSTQVDTSNWTTLQTVWAKGVTATPSGSTDYVRVTTLDRNLPATCNITVVDPAPPIIHVTGISISPTTMKFTSISGSDTATVTVSPSNATNKEIIWDASSSGIISITPSSQDSRIATIAPVSRGLVDAIANSQDGGFTARCRVQVGDDISSVTLNKHSTTIAVGGTDTLTATLLPATAFNTNVFWTTDNPSIATVSGGTVSGVAAGTTTIWAKASGDDSIKDSCTVVVSNSTYATAVYPDPDNATISSGTTGNTFTPNGFDVYPIGSTYDSAVYSIASGSSHLQLMNANTGSVKGLSAGDAVLRLTLTCGSNTVIGDINITIT